MKSKAFHLAYLSLFSILVFSCSKAPSHLKVIPKDAAVVGNINAMQLAMKAGFEKIQNYEFVKAYRRNFQKNQNRLYFKISNQTLSLGELIFLKTFTFFQWDKVKLKEWHLLLKLVTPLLLIILF